MENLIHKHSYARSPIRTYTGEEEGLGEDGHAHSRGELEVTPVMTSQVPSELCGSEALCFLVLSRFLPHSFVALVNLVSMVMCTRLIPLSSQPPPSPPPTTSRSAPGSPPRRDSRASSIRRLCQRPWVRAPPRYPTPSRARCPPTAGWACR